jgi:hypothetical protein
LSFVDEGASYKSSVGYFTYDAEGAITSQHVVFPNFSGTGSGLAGGGELKPGDTATIGTFSPGVKLGFFLLANGYKNANAPMWTTIPALNSDGKDHDAVIVLEGIGTLIGFEDLKNLGDRDYNDAILLVTTAAHEVAEDESVPLEEIAEDNAILPVTDAVEETVEQVESAPSLFDVVAQGVSLTLGVSIHEATAIVLEHGVIAVDHALAFATDAKSFWESLLGYDILGSRTAAGGGGSNDGGSIGYRIDIQLRSPVTGEAVTTEHVALTIVASPNSIVDIIMVPFHPETESYAVDLEDLNLSPGQYDLYLGFRNGTHHLIRLLIPNVG